MIKYGKESYQQNYSTFKFVRNCKNSISGQKHASIFVHGDTVINV